MGNQHFISRMRNSSPHPPPLTCVKYVSFVNRRFNPETVHFLSSEGGHFQAFGAINIINVLFRFCRLWGKARLQETQAEILSNAVFCSIFSTQKTAGRGKCQSRPTKVFWPQECNVSGSNGQFDKWHLFRASTRKCVIHYALALFREGEIQKAREGCGCPKFVAGQVFRQGQLLLAPLRPPQASWVFWEIL